MDIEVKFYKFNFLRKLIIYYKIKTWFDGRSYVRVTFS